MKGRTPSVTLNGNPMMSVPGQMYEGTCADCGGKLYLFIDANNISTALVDWPVHTDEFHTLGDVKAASIRITPRRRRQPRLDP